MTATMANTLDNLPVWRQAMRISLQVCKFILPVLPSEEKWGLSSQLRRSVQSIPANIAKGYGRMDYQDTVRYCARAKSSLQETYTHLTLAHQLGYISDASYVDSVEQTGKLEGLLDGYIASLKRRSDGIDIHPGEQTNSTSQASGGDRLGCPYES